MYKVSQVLSLTLILAVILSACNFSKSTSNNNVDDGKLKVYTSFYAMYDFANKIGGDKINIKNLVPSGTEPHDWEPTPRNIADIQNSDVLIYSGAGMEGWISKVIDSISNDKLIILEASKGIPLLKNDEGNELQYDPHVWLNPMYAKIQMKNIKDAFETADPKNKEYYEKNYSENVKRLKDLDAEYKSVLSKLPKKDFVVAHKAFGYLSNAYGLKEVAIEGLTADSEPSPSRMVEISNFAKTNNIKYIFFEELISPKVAQTIAKEVGAKTAVLNPLEGLSEGSLHDGKEYFSVMEDNLDALSKALQ